MTIIERRRWGKAGQRLTSEEIRKADARARRDAYGRAAAEQQDYRRWAAGLVVPDRITTALDAMGLYGPEVDVACGAREPDVDRWEAGELYPTWEQLQRLAELTGCSTGMFMLRERRLKGGETSLRFHMPLEEEPPPVMTFTPEAIAVMKAGLS